MKRGWALKNFVCLPNNFDFAAHLQRSWCLFAYPSLSLSFLHSPAWLLPVWGRCCLKLVNWMDLYWCSITVYILYHFVGKYFSHHLLQLLSFLAGVSALVFGCLGMTRIFRVSRRVSYCRPSGILRLQLLRAQAIWSCYHWSVIEPSPAKTLASWTPVSPRMADIAAACKSLV